MDYFDTHCHIDMKRFNKDRAAVIERAREAGVKRIVNVGIDPASNRKGLELASKYPEVLCGMGFGPTEVVRAPESEIEKEIGFIREHKEDIVCVGEVGLDYYWIKEGKKKEKQRKWFTAFIELANEINRPLSVHARDAEGDCLRILRKKAETGVIMHCFSGTKEQAKQAADQGCFISVPTNVLYSDREKELVKALPLERIVCETDSPFLFKGKRNEPANVVLAVKEVAGIRGLREEEAGKIIFKNSSEIFTLHI